ncbi:hypothetical protein HN385_03665 [archaeon]|jgi:hypothetical protein|nr:hypothetical protein [archaeon]MBT3451707.1 hypothetical protein [archaeon]MBT6869795.1 hypothetical protein [archaeon]MBT7192750.1 hypothetical protein [archaeon]MBT7380775.1 hypothetical protein [archaeon]
MRKNNIKEINNYNSLNEVINEEHTLGYSNKEIRLYPRLEEETKERYRLKTKFLLKDKKLDFGPEIEEIFASQLWLFDVLIERGRNYELAKNQVESSLISKKYDRPVWEIMKDHANLSLLLRVHSDEVLTYKYPFVNETKNYF